MIIAFEPFGREHVPNEYQDLRTKQMHHLRTGWRIKTAKEQDDWWKSLDTTKCHIQAFSGEAFGVIVAIGYVILDNIDWHDRRAELGGIVSKPEQNDTVLLEALKQAINHGFNNMGLVRIDAVCYSNAPERIKLIEDLGFTKEGIKIDCHYWDGKWHDEILYGLVKK